ncbi:YneF family protein [Cohnella terricola]|uniref:YneF family protein n=1 Tax=Cohnella terricola TaxID=1289167 RepID=A0A559JTP6_9BACL|nr:YneF family protein [Cohnella terricola]TVY03227.1 YneF family protein [Cohnella terricola]
MWSYIIPIVTLIVGIIVGFIIGVFYLRSQMTKMQNNPEMLQKMAKQMGYNMNNQQIAKAQQMMKNQGSGPKQNQGGSNRNNPKFRR